ncbi:uncharacterized protein LOC117296738 [Asterias rubens]|uniref:uncharacterized protein LOC117296738 n=1 Tax=Asterias rubens TaxID=7604 RepID=UPI0014558F78|nr:uncharacterized protein LOC117296738 [Asterias rubens]
MDVKRGHCWRCEKLLPKHLVCCNLCSMAEYCSTLCQDTDRIRHTSVECLMFGPKICNNCGYKGNTKLCDGCNEVWYCRPRCKLLDLKDHKPFCNKVKASIKSLATDLTLIRPRLRLDDTHYYFGNTMAKDFLQLDNNEWSEMENKTDVRLVRDFHILSAGCGDLRNTVLTAASLPARYQGSLYITLNDFDPFVMARNVLFLFMLVRFADTEGIESSLTTIWYSVHIAKKEYDLIKTSLDELIQMTPQSLFNNTKGLVSVFSTDLMSLRQTWLGWKSLECQRDKRSSINLRQQRADSLRSQKVKQGHIIYLSRLTPNDKQVMENCFKHGLFIPTETTESNLPFDNPTMTGQKAPAGIKRSVPKDSTLFYCIGVDSNPFVAWDCLRVRESETRPYPTPIVMYHSYITKLLQKVKSLIQQGRLNIQVSLANCLNFPSIHKSLKMSNYDRIFTSNLADYLGIARLLQTFKLLLNFNNSFSALVTETMNWFKLIPEADLEKLQETPEIWKCFAAYIQDIPQMTHDLPMTFDTGFNSLREYYNITSCFLEYLRADIMAGEIETEPLENVPSLKTTMEYNGMRMRDFRKKQNKIVPFQYRVNARDLNMMIGCNRAVEWCLSLND